jgi:hypothetical protein
MNVVKVVVSGIPARASETGLWTSSVKISPDT